MPVTDAMFSVTQQWRFKMQCCITRYTFGGAGATNFFLIRRRHGTRSVACSLLISAASGVNFLNSEIAKSKVRLAIENQRIFKTRFVRPGVTRNAELQLKIRSSWHSEQNEELLHGTCPQPSNTVHRSHIFKQPRVKYLNTLYY